MSARCWALLTVLVCACSPQESAAPEAATSQASDLDETESEVAQSQPDVPPPSAALVGDAADRELEILDMAHAESADDFLLNLPGSSGLQAAAAADLVPVGGLSVGTPQRGGLANAVQLPPRPHLYTRRHPERSYGSTHTIRTIQTALSSLRKDHGVSREVMVGDLSVKSGGPLSPHVSHQSGRDIDIRLLLADGISRKTVPVSASQVDWDATWRLVQSFLETGKVNVIFLDFNRQAHLHAAALRAGVHETVVRRWFQWPVRGGRGMIRHEDGHRAHVHVRLECGEAEPHCR